MNDTCENTLYCPNCGLQTPHTRQEEPVMVTHAVHNPIGPDKAIRLGCEMMACDFCGQKQHDMETLSQSIAIAQDRLVSDTVAEEINCLSTCWRTTLDRRLLIIAAAVVLTTGIARLWGEDFSMACAAGMQAIGFIWIGRTRSIERTAVNRWANTKASK